MITEEAFYQMFWIFQVLLLIAQLFILWATWKITHRKWKH